MSSAFQNLHFSSPIEALQAALVFLIMLTVLVAAHELGHYLFARLFNMGVEEFSIGMFGKKPLLRYMQVKYRIPVRLGQDPYRTSRGGGLEFEGGGGLPSAPPVVLDTPSGQVIEETTQFTVRPWPIGGFVRIKGMAPEEDGGEVAIPGGFYSKPPWQRLIVLVAGPAFSVLAGVVTIVVIAMTVGVNQPVNDPVVGDMLKGKPAWQAGLRPNDRILSIDGDPINSFYQLLVHVRDSAGKSLHFTYLRGGKSGAATIVPYLQDDPTPVYGSDLEPTGEMRRQALIGLLHTSRFVRQGFGEAVKEAVSIPVLTVEGLFDSIRHPQTLKDSVGGPIAMMNATSEAVQTNFVSVASLAAIISISLGILNLLPIFPLDGGQIMVALAEMVRGGRRLSFQVQNLVGVVGFCIVLMIFGGVMLVDVTRILQKPAPEPEIIKAAAPK